MKLGILADIVSGFAFDSKRFNSDKIGTPIIRIRDVSRGFTETYFNGQYDDSYLISQGDFLITMDGEFKVAEWTGPDALLNQRVCKIFPMDFNINPRYLLHMLPRELKRIEDHTPFVTVKHLSVKKIKDIQIPLPPLPVQRRIAAILDAADEHRRKTQALIEKYDELAQSVFLEMFGDPVRNEKGWEVTTIRNMVQEVKYGTSKKASESGKYPYLRMNNINYNGNMDFSSLKYIDVDDRNKHKYVTKKGDVLFNRTNSKELVGKTGIVSTDDEMILAGYLIRIRVKKGINPYYLWGHLNSPWAKLKLTNMCKNIVGMANINAQELQDIPILHPPIDLQNRFESIIQSIQKQKAIVENSQKHSETLFQSLLQRAFRGELVGEEVVE